MTDCLKKRLENTAGYFWFWSINSIFFNQLQGCSWNHEIECSTHIQICICKPDCRAKSPSFCFPEMPFTFTRFMFNTWTGTPGPVAGCWTCAAWLVVTNPYFEYKLNPDLMARILFLFSKLIQRRLQGAASPHTFSSVSHLYHAVYRTL